MPGEFAVLTLVNETLGMLDPRAHGKGLLDHVDARPEQRLLGIGGAVADGQDQGIRGELMLLFPVHIFNGAYFARFHHHVGQLGGKTHLASQGDNFLPNGRHHPGPSYTVLATATRWA